MNKFVSAMAVGLALTVATPSQAADVLTVVPNGNAAVEGSALIFAPLGNGSAGGFTQQLIIAASQLSAFSPGSVINSLGFRLNGGESTITTNLTFANFGIQIGSSARTFGSESSVFADNMGADTILARSGALTILGGSLVGGSATVNPFYDILFSQGYTYQGGDLVITLRNDSTSGRVPLDGLAADNSAIRSVLGSSATSTAGTTGFFNVPVIRLGSTSAIAAVPEPATWAMMILGMGVLGAALRRQRQPAKVRFAF